MLEAEAIMHHQINRDEECWEIPGMRAAMRLLIRERTRLGDREPILVNCFFSPRRAPAAPRTVSTRVMKRRLVPADKRVG